MPIVINGSTGISGTDGSAATPAVQGTDTNTGMFFPAADQIAFAEGGTEVMRIDASGQVGIGTSSPTARLDLSAASYCAAQVNSGSVQGQLAANAGGSIDIRAVSNHPVQVFTNNTERMRVTADGKIGIGTTAPLAALSVKGTSSSSAPTGGDGIHIYAANGYATADFCGTLAGYIDFSKGDGSDYQGRLLYDNVNNEMVFAAGGGSRFVVRTTRTECLGTGSRGGSGPVLTTNDSLGSLFRNAGYIEFNSDIGAIGLNYFVSDESKKDNIRPSTFSSSALIANIRFISFDWKPGTGQSGHVDVGVSAQQLRSLDGRLTNELADGSLMVNEPALVAHLGKALQEALSKIDALEARIAALEAR